MYDTFDGMSTPTENDISKDGVAASSLLVEQAKDELNHYWAYSPICKVQSNIASIGYPISHVNMVEGKVEDTIPDIVPNKIAVLRLDTDWYESTKHELLYLYPKLIRGGILIIDDYGFWEGSRKAVDEFFEQIGEKPTLNVVNDQFGNCVRWCVKQ
jgi:hypothetical protein